MASYSAFASGPSPRSQSILDFIWELGRRENCVLTSFCVWLLELLTVSTLLSSRALIYPIPHRYDLWIGFLHLYANWKYFLSWKLGNIHKNREHNCLVCPLHRSLLRFFVYSFKTQVYLSRLFCYTTASAFFRNLSLSHVLNRSNGELRWYSVSILLFIVKGSDR